ncbi:MAG TPA: hypothetical protein VHT26_16255 [Trebonia sp.]|jgi:hypothetical protein|nr:hypothetical protein [Trebonia sp.]
MYQRFPGDAAQSGEPSSPANAPQSVLRAVKVMYVGLAASLIGIAVDMTTLSSTRSAILKRNPTYTATQLNNAEHLQIGLFIAGGLIGAALWLWMAQSCRAGKGWARVVSTVFFGIDTLSVLVGFAAVQGGGLSRIFGTLVWVIGLITIILLWQRSSSDYFRAPRYQ